VTNEVSIVTVVGKVGVVVVVLVLVLVEEQMYVDETVFLEKFKDNNKKCMGKFFFKVFALKLMFIKFC
jgi:hypothetical protein